MNSILSPPSVTLDEPLGKNQLFLALPRGGEARPLLPLAIPTGAAHTGLLTSAPAVALLLGDPERPGPATAPRARPSVRRW